MSDCVFVLNGPNLNLLGEREPHLYGTTTLKDVEAACRALTEPAGLELMFRQSNREHELIDWIHEARRSKGIVINPAGFSYHSVPILDALKMCVCPVIEVHISNIHLRAQSEASWRGDSLMSAAATGVVVGLGVNGYRLAVQHLIHLNAPG